MDDSADRLTLLEASCVVAGLGVGGGLMAVPYLASLSGVAPILVLTGAAYVLSVVLHLMIAEAVVRDGKSRQLLEVLRRQVFTGRAGAALAWIFFALIGVGLTFTLAAYIVACGEILVMLLGVPLWVGEFASYAAAAGVVFFGLKAVGFIEKYAVAGIGVILAVLAFASIGHPFRDLPCFTGNRNATLALYGMLMLGFSCFWSVPQAVKGLSHDRRRIPHAIAAGIGINLCFVLLLTFMAIGVSKEVTEVAINGWVAALGGWARVLGSGTLILALLTSYWSTSFAFATIVQERLSWPYPVCWLIATAPTFFLAVSGLTGFLGFMRITGGIVGLALALLMIPTLRASRRNTAAQPAPFVLGVWGGTAAQAVVIAALLLMGIGSLVPLE